MGLTVELFMAHLWMQSCVGRVANEWQALALEAAGAKLTGDAGRPVVALDRVGERGRNGTVVLSAGPASAAGWVLLGESDVSVNGDRLHTGIRVLRDRDEIRCGGSRVFFSTERLPQVEPFPGTEQPVLCPRCRQVIEPGTPAVRCPGANCGLWFHQSEEVLPCWTGYSAQPFKTCAMCDYPARLYPEADFRWTPEGL